MQKVLDVDYSIKIIIKITYERVLILNFSIGSWSASTSPARSPSPAHYRIHGGQHGRPSRKYQLHHPTFGTTSLEQRSRSPSPARLQEMHDRDMYRNEMGTEYCKFFEFCYVIKSLCHKFSLNIVILKQRRRKII